MSTSGGQGWLGDHIRRGWCTAVVTGKRPKVSNVSLGLLMVEAVRSRWARSRLGGRTALRQRGFLRAGPEPRVRGGPAKETQHPLLRQNRVVGPSSSRQALWGGLRRIPRSGGCRVRRQAGDQTNAALVAPTEVRQRRTSCRRGATA